MLGLYYLIGQIKLSFAHLIKQHYNTAYKIHELTYNSTPDDANNTFNEITQKCDFFNIFNNLEYNTFLPEETWQDLMDLNNFLIENGIDKIEQTSLQTILEKSVRTSKKEVTGQFTTPAKLAEALVKITIRDLRADCIDPCCGTGTIAKEVLTYKKIYLKSVEIATENHMGC